MLLVHGDRNLCDRISKAMKSHGSAMLQSASTAVLGASMIIDGGFDIALINAILPDASGIELARLTATPVLMLSESARISRELQRLGLQFLQTPFGVDVLLAESNRVMLERAAQMRQVKLPMATTALNLESLRAETAQAHREFDAIVKHLGYLRP